MDESGATADDLSVWERVREGTARSRGGPRRVTGRRSRRSSSATTTASTGSAPACSGDADETADLAQDVCVALPARLASWRGESRFTTWLYRVVVNAARDALRRKDARRRGERSYAETEALLRIDDASPACESGWLRRALGQLPEDLRVTVFLVLEEELRHAEAGEVLGVSESTVSWRMHEVRKRLRALAAGGEEGSP